MSINKEGAAAANEQRPDAKASDSNYYYTISDLVGQIFRICSQINQFTKASAYATYLDGKVECVIIAGGNRYEIIPDQKAGIANLTRCLSVMEFLEVMLCGRN